MKTRSFIRFFFYLMIMLSIPLFLVKERRVISSKKNAQIVLADPNFQQQLEQPKSVHFIALVSLKGGSMDVEKHLLSALEQTYPLERIFYFTQEKNDANAHHLKELIAKHGVEEFVHVIESSSFHSYLKAYDSILTKLDDEMVAVHMRGCDFFANKEVLNKINYYYLNNDVWLTYGQFVGVDSYDKGLFEARPNKRAQKKRVHQTPWLHANFKTFAIKTYKNMRKDRFEMENFLLSIRTEEQLLRPLAIYAAGHLRFIPDVLTIKGHGSRVKKQPRKVSVKSQQVKRYS